MKHYSGISKNNADRYISGYLEDPGQAAVINMEVRRIFPCANASEGWTFYHTFNTTLWLENKYSELNFKWSSIWLIMFYCFRKELHSFEHESSSIYPNYVDQDDDVEHILLCCKGFKYFCKMNIGWDVEFWNYMQPVYSLYSWRYAGTP